MEGKKAFCMLQFKSDAKLTSEEFVKVFKEFDKDGKIIFHIIRKYIEYKTINLHFVICFVFRFCL